MNIFFKVLKIKSVLTVHVMMVYKDFEDLLMKQLIEVKAFVSFYE